MMHQTGTLASVESDPGAEPGHTADSLSPDSSVEAATETVALSDRPYHPKRPHKKSRAGCKQCKTRKVKCDEGRPSCRACTLRREGCVYPSRAPSSRTVSPAAAKSRPVATTAASSPPEHAPPAREDQGADRGTLVVAEPLFKPAPVADATDMRMLWFYTVETYTSFTIGTGRSDVLDRVLKVKLIEHAFTSPFLMQCIMGLSALRLQSLDQPIEPAKAISYRAKAFAGYRAAIEAANPSDFPALLAASLVMCALSTQMFREGSNTTALYIVDWMQVWRGIGLIVELITPQSIHESGLAVLFYRPPMDLLKTSRHIPNHLLFMVSSIKPGDADYEHQQTYYEMLQLLGCLYMELEHGFSPILNLRTITFFTFTPRPFIPLAKEHRPRSLIILAYYLCFAKLCNEVWWMQGIADPQLKQICECVGDTWAHLLRVPRKVMALETQPAIARVLLGNDAWTPPVTDALDENRDPKRGLKMIDNAGRDVRIVNGRYTIEPSSPKLPNEAGSVPNRYIGAEAFGIGHPLEDHCPTPSPPPSSDGAFSG